MSGLEGWTTATARTSGNVSSGCRYKTGASCRASVAPVSVRESVPGADDGSGGTWRRGPHPIDATYSATEITCPATGATHRRVTQLEASFRPELARPSE